MTIIYIWNLLFIVRLTLKQFSKPHDKEGATKNPGSEIPGGGGGAVLYQHQTHQRLPIVQEKERGRERDDWDEIPEGAHSAEVIWVLEKNSILDTGISEDRWVPKAPPQK